MFSYNRLLIHNNIYTLVNYYLNDFCLEYFVSIALIQVSTCILN